MYLDPATLERMAMDALENARVDGRLATVGDHSFDLQIVEGGTRTNEHGVWFTLRLIAWDGGSIRDVKEQECVVIPNIADDERIPAYLAGWALGTRRLMLSTGDAVETLMPHDFIPRTAFQDPACTTVEQFAERVGVQGPAAEAVDFEDLTGTQAIAENRDLERRIEEDPDRVENWLVYADWLTEQGDPRGEYISCSVPTASPAAQRAGGALFGKHQQYFAGQLATSEELEYYIQLKWDSGWIESAHLWSEYEITKKIPKLVERATRTLFALPSSKFLRKLTIGCIDYEGDCNFDRLYPLFGPRPTMRELFIGDTEAEQQEISWTHAGDMTVINELFPNLRKLKVHAGSMSLVGALNYPKLESLVIESGGLSAETVRAIATANLPELKELVIWFGSSSYGGDATLADIAPILAGERLPKLQRLGLCNSEFADELCAVLADAPVLARIHALDLSKGVMSDAGAKVLLESRAHLAHLKELDVSDNFLSEDGLALVRTLDAEVAVGHHQKQLYGGDDDRYVSIAE